MVANGEDVEMADGAGLLELFDQLGMGAKWVVAEVNGDAIDRAQMPQVRLADGDRIELVRAVAGG
ncbi:MAG TPA: sulfur carrier protein ThiS [Acidimicrobiales bacterium]|nr:sulfur carrier protein ThiS [Acidimicrobiales bacterium]